MIPRFSLFGEPATWKDNIREDANGRWVQWSAVEKYVSYLKDQGISFDPVIVDPVTQTYTDAELRAAIEQYDEVEEAFEDNDDIDVLEYMERHGKDSSL